MSWAVRAWREADGQSGISVGTCHPVGWNNQVAEIILHDRDIDDFFAECWAARLRAREAKDRLDEPMPGPYDAWDYV